MSSTTSKRSVTPLVLHKTDIEHMAPECFPHPSEGGNVSWKTLVSSEKSATDTFTVGMATCPPATPSGCLAGHLKLHRHMHPELYHVTEGRGIVTVDGREYGVGKGSVVFIPGDVEHGVRNTGEVGLVWLYVFAAEGFEEVLYRFSGLERRDEEGKGGMSKL